MDKEVTKHIKESKRKKKTSKKTLIVFTIIFKIFIKQQQANFFTTWSSSTIKEVGDKFHYNFKASLRVHPLKYRGVNLHEIT